MSYDDFLAADQIHGANNTRDEIRKATAAVITYAFRKAQDAAAINLARQLVDELGLNGRPMQTSSHYRKNNPKWVGKL